ncbi:MAG: carboxypeptidase regulatory-like domain-containing protein [Thermoanaerobaculia bacterium]
MRRILITGLLLSLAATTAFAGSVTGTITYDDRVPPPGKGPFSPIKMDADPACAAKYDGDLPASGQLVLGDGNALGNVFVQVKNAPAGSGAAPSEAVVIDQNGCMYHPRVVGVRVGQPLMFKNSDGILHNVHGRPKENREFNIGMPPTLKQKDQTFNKPEPLFPVKCDVHPWMQSYVAVMTHPYFAVTGENGKFSLANVPDGDYEIEAWHEKLGTQTAKVTVSGGAATADFTFKIP